MEEEDTSFGKIKLLEKSVRLGRNPVVDGCRMNDYPTPEEWDRYADYVDCLEDRQGCEDEFREAEYWDFYDEDQ